MNSCYHERPIPGETKEYREARDGLLRAELELIEQTEKAAAMRRALPAGPVLAPVATAGSDAGGARYRLAPQV
jgi:predicted dithiol-disulfide oxidoreductase (DUF899 family)